MYVAKTKKYYWIKLKTDFFNLAEIDFLLGQENGCQYIVLYQMLCLQTANNDGILASRVGEMIIPFDTEKIARDTKYFKKDTIIVALELFKKLNLIYIHEYSCFQIASFEEMVGSETTKAELMRNKRAKDKELKAGNIVTEILPSQNELSYEEKDIELDKEIDEDIYVEKDSSDGMIEDNMDKIFKSISSLELVQEIDSKYDDILKSKNLYFPNSNYLPAKVKSQLKLYQLAIKTLYDTDQTELIEKVDLLILQKVYGKVLRAKQISNIVEYYISSLTNELTK